VRHITSGEYAVAFHSELEARWQSGRWSIDSFRTLIHSGSALNAFQAFSARGKVVEWDR